MSALKITGRMVTFSRITFETSEQEAIREQLLAMSKNNPFYGTPVVIDSTVEQELIELIQLLLSLDLQPMAVVEGLLAEQAREIQFPVLPKDRAVQRIQATNEQTAIVKAPKNTPEPVQNHSDNDDEPAEESTKTQHSFSMELDFSSSSEPTMTFSTNMIDEKSTDNTNLDANKDKKSTSAHETSEHQAENSIQIEHKTSFHNMMLRTGQSLVQDTGDVILMASMNNGAEIIASGNIHIYGYARGRIMAGASGDKNARIFCQYLDAELISIAGTYCLADDIPAHALHTSSYIYLNDEHELVFEAFNPNSI